MSDGRGLRINTLELRFGQDYDPAVLQQLMQHINELTRLNQKFIQMLRAGQSGQVLSKVNEQDLIAEWTTINSGPPGPQGPQGPPGTNGVNGANGAPGADGVVQALVDGIGIEIDSTDPANPIIHLLQREFVTVAVAAGSTNDLAPAGFGSRTRILEIDTAAGDATITGLIAGVDMQELVIVNTTNLLTLNDLDGGSSAANQFQIGVSPTLIAKESVRAIYSEDKGLWIVQS